MISINFDEENKKILIIGGGKQAIEKGKKFPNCLYLSPSFIDEVPEDKRILKVYECDDIKDAFLVVAATNNKDLNHQIVMDCNENNILVANINHDEMASVHFEKELDYPYLHLAFTTKGTCPGYHKILEKDLDCLYQEHEPVLEDLQVIRARALETINKFSVRNEFLLNIVEKEKEFLHFLAQAIEMNQCKILAFHSLPTEENKTILNEFIKNIEIPSFYCFKTNFKETIDILDSLQIDAQYLPVTLRPGKASSQMQEVLEGKNYKLITFEDYELRKIMRQAHYQIYIYHPSKNNTLKSHLARSYMVCDYNDELPENLECKACACLLLKGGHFQKDIEPLKEKYPNIQFDSKCLFEQDFFIPLLLEKIGD